MQKSHYTSCAMRVGVKPSLLLKYEKAFSNSCLAAYWTLTIGHKTDGAVRNDTRSVSDSSDKTSSIASLFLFFLGSH